MALPQLQFLNLPQIDGQIAQQRQAEVQNALAPYMMQKAQMDAERGGLEMQKFREDMTQQRQIRDAIAAEYSANAAQQSSPSTAAQSMASPQSVGQQAVDHRAKQATMLRRQAEIYLKYGNVDAANKLGEQALKLEPEWSTTPQYDQSGNAFVLSKQGGRQMLDGIKSRDELVADDLGGARVLRTKYSADPVSTLAKSQSPDSIASNATQIRGQNLTDARGREANDLKRQELVNGGKAPAGYRWNQDGTLEAIPGGPGDKLPESQQKQVVGVNNLSSAIKEYRAELAGYGKFDGLSPDARAKMGTKYNNMMLQAKEAYNLGVLNGPDFDILQSVITDPRSLKGAVTSKDALDSQASELDRIMQGVAGVSSKARQPQQAGGAATKPATTTPRTGDRVDGFMFLGGNPADPNRWKKVDK